MFAARTINWLAISCLVAGIAGTFGLMDIPLVGHVLLFGGGVALHLLAHLILGRLEKEV